MINIVEWTTKINKCFWLLHLLHRKRELCLNNQLFSSGKNHRNWKNREREKCGVRTWRSRYEKQLGLKQGEQQQRGWPAEYGELRKPVQEQGRKWGRKGLPTQHRGSRCPSKFRGSYPPGQQGTSSGLLHYVMCTHPAHGMVTHQAQTGGSSRLLIWALAGGLPAWLSGILRLYCSHTSGVRIVPLFREVKVMIDIKLFYVILLLPLLAKIVPHSSPHGSIKSSLRSTFICHV